MNTKIVQLIEDLKAKSPLYIRVKVLPKSPKNEVVEVMEDGTYKIRIAAPAEGGKANAELIKFLKKALGANKITILSGKADRLKLIKVT
ncbi:hypothetical protein COY07_02810 [Candidatus Peregrinibacteria bacterium CG_4_10_14_0_2_um_filter_43_11]|nr:MAG: hypothetical protein COY07_02810 [Candidatus Peregrinibacteria bacterium CG_4_10_14_0_2_um_filter_43_11]